MLEEVLARFEAHAPLSVMMRLALERAMPAGWIDEVFEQTCQRRYPRELLFSTVVKLTSLVSLGLRPSLHAAAKKEAQLPVSIAALYDKVRRTEPAILSKLVQHSAQRLVPVVEAMGITQSLPGWQLRVVDGQPSAGQREALGAIAGLSGCGATGPHAGGVRRRPRAGDGHRGLRGRARPGACGDGVTAGARAAGAVVDGPTATSARETIAQGWDKAGAGFIVREHQKHPRLIEQGDWVACGRVETGTLQEQAIRIEEGQPPWRRIELRDSIGQPRMQTPCCVCGAICRRRSVRSRLHGCTASAGASRACSNGWSRCCKARFAAWAIRARRCWALQWRSWPTTVLHLLEHSVEQAHREELPDLDVSTYYIAVALRAEYEGMLIVLPAAAWQCWSDADPRSVADRLLELARSLDPRRLATHKRGPKIKKPKGYVDAATARSHVSTARVLEMAQGRRP